MEAGGALDPTGGGWVSSPMTSHRLLNPARRPHRAPTLAVLMLALVATACETRRAPPPGGDGAPLAGAEGPEAPLTVDSVASWGSDTLWLPAAAAGPEVAYLSRGEQRVYVALDARDAVRHALDAYISVSTDLWRIRFPDDDPRVPIMPDDEAREFEEIPLSEWTATAAPSLGDERLLRGSLAVYMLRAGCVPTVAGIRPRSVLSASVPELSLRTVRPGGDALAAERFGVVGRAALHREKGCTGPADTVPLLGWAVDAQLPPPPPILRR